MGWKATAQNDTLLMEVAVVNDGEVSVKTKPFLGFVTAGAD